MKNVIFAIFALIFTSGCSDKNYIHEPLKNELLAYTSKSEIINKDERILVLGTYLSPTTNDIVNERFIVSIYPKDSVVNIDSFALNGSKNGVKVKIIEDKDELLNLVSFQMPWGAYYEMVSPSISGDTLNITFEIYPSKLVSLRFQKVSKSMYWNGATSNK